MWERSEVGIAVLADRLRRLVAEGLLTRAPARRGQRAGVESMADEQQERPVAVLR